MLASEFARKGVDAAHALDRNQEGLVRREPCVGQRRNLLAQMVLQFRHVDGMDRLATVQIAAPQINLLLECRRRIARHVSGPLRQGRDGRRWIGGSPGKPPAKGNAASRPPFPTACGLQRVEPGPGVTR